LCVNISVNGCVNMSKETTHIRIDRDLKTMLEEQAGPEESVNDVVRRLLTAVNNGVNQDVNLDQPLVNDGLTELESRVNTKLTALTERFDNFIATVFHGEDKTGHALQMIYEIQDRLTNLESQTGCTCNRLPPAPGDHQEAGVINHEVSPVQEHETCNVPGEESIPDDQERITLTEEIRLALTSHVEKLQESGMSYQVIADHLGMGKGRISELKSGKLKTLTRSQYETLISL